jgi:hypothetical protein
MANGQKLQDSKHDMRECTFIIQDQSIRPKFRSSPTNTHITLPVFPRNNVGSLFDLIHETQKEQCPCDKKYGAFWASVMLTRSFWPKN